MKLGVFSVCTPDYKPLEALAILKEIGYLGVEWRICEDKGGLSSPGFWSGNRTSMTAEQLIANAQGLKKEAATLGMEMPSLGTYIDCHDLDAVEACMKAALAIGANAIRVKPGDFNPKNGRYNEQKNQAKEMYTKVAELARNYNVRALIETHMGQLAPSVSKAMSIIKGLDPSLVGIMWDPGNQISEGGETYRMAIDIAGEYLSEVHVKNVKWIKGDGHSNLSEWGVTAAPIDEGIVNWRHVIKELDRAQYNGWLFLEDFSTEKPLEERLRYNYDYLSSVLSDLHGEQQCKR